MSLFSFLTSLSLLEQLFSFTFLKYLEFCWPSESLTMIYISLGFLEFLSPFCDRLRLPTISRSLFDDFLGLLASLLDLAYSSAIKESWIFCMARDCDLRVFASSFSSPTSLRILRGSRLDLPSAERFLSLLMACLSSLTRTWSHLAVPRFLLKPIRMRFLTFW